MAAKDGGEVFPKLVLYFILAELLLLACSLRFEPQRDFTSTKRLILQKESSLLQIAVATERFKMDMSKFPTLSRIYESQKALPEFLAASPDALH